MRPLSVLALAMLAAFAVLAAPGGAQARQCEAISQDADAAAAGADTGGLETLYEEAAEGASGCSDRYRVCLGRMVAHAYVDRAYDAHDRGIGRDELNRLIDTAIDWAQTWKVLLARAELREEEKSYDEAAYYFQAALNDLAETSPCPGEEAGVPDRAGLEAIYDRAEISVLLAKDFVEPPTDRAGDPGGLFLSSVRGLEPKERTLPVEFEYDSEAFTPKGVKAAEALAGYLARHKAKYDVLRLSGHTDERGGEAYNCALSHRRLAAVAGYLQQHGLADIPYELYPAGEYQPYGFDDPGRYSQDEIYQANRRVVLIEGGPPQARYCP